MRGVLEDGKSLEREEASWDSERKKEMQAWEGIARKQAEPGWG